MQSVAVPVPVDVPQTCSATGANTGPASCPGSEVCVIPKFELVGTPNAGTCKRSASIPTHCTEIYCNKEPGHVQCAAQDPISIVPTTRTVTTRSTATVTVTLTTCSVWKGRSNLHELVSAVLDPCKPGHISQVNAVMCCTKRKIGCLLFGQYCSTTADSHFGPVPCAEGLKCMINGEIVESGITNRGICGRE